MNDTVKIPTSLVKRLRRVSAKIGVAPDALVKTALANQLDYEEWFLKAVDEGIADLDAGRSFSTREVLAALTKERNERGAHRARGCNFLVATTRDQSAAFFVGELGEAPGSVPESVTPVNTIKARGQPW